MAPLVFPHTSAQPALDAVLCELRIHYLMLGAGGKIQKIRHQSMGAMGAESGMGAGDCDAIIGKLVKVISKKKE